MAVRPRLFRPDHLHLTHEGERIMVALRWNPRARRYTLRLPNGAGPPVMTIPARGNIGDARAFLRTHGTWLVVRLGRLPPPTPIASGVKLPFRGVAHRIVHRPGLRGTVKVEPGARGKRLVVTCEPEHLSRRVIDWLKAAARRDLERAVMRHAAALRVRPSAIRVRDQVSRWGSCSARGVLSFSWRLVMAPPFVLDYLAAHEVAHLVEMNHSERFWRIVWRICPNAEKARAWLAAHGAALHAVGAAEMAGWRR